MYSTEQIRLNYDKVRKAIVLAAQRAERDPSAVKLVVVTKTHPVEVVRAALNAGATILGENYAEEGAEKIKTIGEVPGIAWHMIGHVQSRKADIVVKRFALIHSLDSYKLAERLSRAAEALRWSQPVLIQVNVSGEESKFGYPAWKEEHLSVLVSEVKRVATLPSLEIRGLMTVPPLVEDAEHSRAYFHRLRKIRDKLLSVCPEVNWTELSMGMSGDYEVAVEEGATLVRVGTAILGARDYSKG
jgi:PLP dependent protein